MSDLEPFSTLDFLYLTTTGRRTGRPRQIEIWFVVSDGRFYIFAERARGAQWVRNILANPGVRVRVGNREYPAAARVLDPAADVATWETVRRLAWRKYGWGDGLPVEITPKDENPEPSPGVTPRGAAGRVETRRDGG